MATIDERIFSVVNAASIVSGGIYPDQAPDSATADYIVYNAVGGAPQNTLSSGISIRSVRYQFDNWSATRKQADAIAAALVTLLVAQTGLASNFQATLIDDTLKDYDSDTKLFRTIVDMSIWFYP